MPRQSWAWLGLLLHELLHSAALRAVVHWKAARKECAAQSVGVQGPFARESAAAQSVWMRRHIMRHHLLLLRERGSDGRGERRAACLLRDERLEALAECAQALHRAGRLMAHLAADSAEALSHMYHFV